MNELTFTPLGGIGDVTRNMYLYELSDSILIVDCGLGFADETMLGVDLLLPDISYLTSSKKKIAGMVLTHGHEDHIGALPFILPQLPKFPVFGTPLTAALSNEKLKEYRVPTRVETVQFDSPERTLGDFKVEFIRVTHSVPDSSNIFIKTRAGNFYHGSDFKFDLTPWDGKRTDFLGISRAGIEGVTCLMSDSLGAEREGHTASELELSKAFEEEMRSCRGKFLMTTYSSNISRLNQAIEVGRKMGRKVCFVGRSLHKAKEAAQNLGYMKLEGGLEVRLEDLRKYKDSDLLLLVAGSQGQENSAMTRIAQGEHREIRINREDVVVFSADPIPGNEVAINALIDTIAKTGARVVYSHLSDDFHVSGHGSSLDLLLLAQLLKPQNVLPISGTYRMMIAYKNLMKKIGFNDKNIHLLENGKQLIFSKGSVKYGKKIPIKSVFVDEVSGEEVESFVLRDRQRLSKEGIVVVMVQVDGSTGNMVDKPEVVARGFSPKDNTTVVRRLTQELRGVLSGKNEQVTNWVHVRKLVGNTSEKAIFRELRRRPLVLPVVIEV